jgi:hypothetical protein
MKCRVDRRRGGFTVVEVLLAIMIMGMMFTSITQLMTAAKNARDSVHNMQETQLAGPAVLDMLERDLRGIFTTGLPRSAWLKVTDRVVGGLDADRIDFISTTDSLIARIEDEEFPKRADLNEVGYMLRPNPRNDEFLEVYRREDFGIDDAPFEGGEFTFLSDQVKGFDLEVYFEDGPDVDPLDEWDSGSDDEEMTGLPAAVKISITIELKPRIERESLDVASFRKRTVTYTRWVRLAEDLRFAAGQFPRLALPPGPTSPTDPAPGEGEGEGETAGAPNGSTTQTTGSGQGGEGTKSGGGSTNTSMGSGSDPK